MEGFQVIWDNIAHFMIGRYPSGPLGGLALTFMLALISCILSFFGGVSRIGRTSITVQVEVYAERYDTQGHYIKVTEASLTYVAIDDQGRPRPIERPEP